MVETPVVVNGTLVATLRTTFVAAASTEQGFIGDGGLTDGPNNTLAELQSAPTETVVEKKPGVLWQNFPGSPKAIIYLRAGTERDAGTETAISSLIGTGDMARPPAGGVLGAKSRMYKISVYFATDIADGEQASVTHGWTQRAFVAHGVEDTNGNFVKINGQMVSPATVLALPGCEEFQYCFRDGTNAKYVYNGLNSCIDAIAPPPKVK